jgi:hypothetical protein
METIKRGNKPRNYRIEQFSSMFVFVSIDNMFHSALCSWNLSEKEHSFKKKGQN